MSEIQAQLPIYRHWLNQHVSTGFPRSTTTKERHGYAQENTDNVLVWETLSGEHIAPRQLWSCQSSTSETHYSSDGRVGEYRNILHWVQEKSKGIIENLERAII